MMRGKTFHLRWWVVAIHFAIGPLCFAPPEVNPTLYAELSALALEIRAKYPPDEYHYVSIGSSSNMVIAMLSAMEPGSATPIPSAERFFFRDMVHTVREYLKRSQAGGATPQEDVEIDPPIEKVIDSDMKDAAFDMYNSLIPQLNGKKLLVVGIADTGKSVSGMKWAMEKFLAEKRGGGVVEPLGLVPPRDHRPPGFKFPFDTIPYERFPLLEDCWRTGCFNSAFSVLKDRKAFTPLTDARQSTLGLNYETLVDQLHNQLERDSSSPIRRLPRFQCQSGLASARNPSGSKP